MFQKVLLSAFFFLAIQINGVCQVMTNVSVGKNDDLSKVLSKENRRYIISDNFNLRGKEVTVGGNSILDFQGGSISNGIIRGSKTLILGAPCCLFDDVTLLGTFKGESYPEWFNGDVQKCLDHFKVVKFVDEEYVITSPLYLHFGCKLQGENYNVLKFNLSSDHQGKGCIQVGAYCEVSNFIVYVESDNPALEIKSGYVLSSLSNSDYMQRIAPETTSPGAGTSAAINIHNLTLRTALKESRNSKNTTVISSTPAIWITGGGGYAAYDRDAHMYRIIKAPGMWGLKFNNIDISGRWLIGIKCEQINEDISDEEIIELERLASDHNPNYKYWESHNKRIIQDLKKDHKWGYGWITGCVFENIKIHTAIGGIWLGREHLADGTIISRGTSIQHCVFSNIQMQYWNRINNDKAIDIGSKYFVKLNNCNGITFTNCEPWDWPITTNGIEKPFQIDDSYNVWNITFQGYSQWNSTTTNFIQYENGSSTPLCNENRVVLSIPEASFGMGNVAVLDDYIDYTHYKATKPETMKCNKQLRLLPPGTYSIPNISNKVLREFFQITNSQSYSLNQRVSNAWLEVKLITDPSIALGTQYNRVVTIHYTLGNKMHQLTLLADAPVDRALKQTDWNFDY